VATLLGILALVPFGSGEEPPQPLAQAHAHNDYEHPRPLLDALDHGFMGIEADIHLVDGELLVGHDLKSTKTGRTLEALYLGPLADRVKANQGRVFPNAGAVTLLIDFKTPAAETWLTLRPLLEKFRAILTEATPDGVRERAVTVILSGNRPVAELTAEPRRLAFIDGRPDDLDRDVPSTLVPLISASWPSLFPWHGQGPMPGSEWERLRAFTAKAHRQGKKVRFWGTRDDPAIWDVQRAAGVDLINADDLPKLRDYLNHAKVPANPTDPR
jgi:hypothetical protein